MTKFNKAFSLIELMVVIGIIAILVIAGVPLYQDFTIRSKISNAIKVIDGINTQIKSSFEENGVFPSSFVTNGLTITNGGGAQAVNMGNLYSISYSRDAGGSIATIAYAITGLDGITSYIAPPNAGGYNNIHYGLKESSGSMVTVCGAWNGSLNSDIPTKYMPTNCNCQHILTFSTGGSCL